MKGSWLLLGMAVSSGVVIWRREAHHAPVSLRNKVVMVTGAASGIGRVTAKAFASEGASVVLVDVDEDKLASVEQELAQNGGPTLGVRADISKDEEIENLVWRVMQEFRRIDVLVNNAGIFVGGAFQETDPARLRQIVDVNLYGAMRLTRAVLPLMVSAQSGCIVNVSSSAGVLASPGEILYAATKAGLIAFSDGLRRELGESAIHVALILPGWTDTSMTKDLDKQAMRSQGLLTPFMAVQSPETVAQSIVDAVRYRRREDVPGAVQFRVGTAVSRITTPVLDLYFRLFTRPGPVSKALKNS